MKTRLHYYHFDVSNEKDAKAYNKLCKELKGMGLKKFASIARDNYEFYRDHIKSLDKQEIELETAYLFHNQWNTTPTNTSKQGLRVFDWSEPIYRDEMIKEGMWLEQTEEMREIRRETVTCGYCGKHDKKANRNVFHLGCLGSGYLKQDELFLLRFKAVCEGLVNREPLTKEEKNLLLPLYIEAQTYGNDEKSTRRIAEKKARLEKDYREAKERAEAEYKGFLWLVDHGINTDNVIYYSHTGRFCFGWRSPLTSEVKSRLLDEISEFPFEYEIKS